MADYAIGDVQGCYNSLQRLLEAIDFNDRVDKLWFVGDLVNRGPQSLAVLRFVKQLSIKPHITLGNHDLHLLGLLFDPEPHVNLDDTLEDVLRAPDRDELGHWLRQQSILVYDKTLNVVMCHAGIAPIFTLADAQARALELEHVLSGDHYLEFLKNMYGNEPNQWHNNLNGIERLRFICNAFTRMRYCNAEGRLMLKNKGRIQDAEPSLHPWFAVPSRQNIQADIVFGHWAALEGKCSKPHVHAIDTGCVWGRKLTALRLQDMQRFAVQSEN